MSLVLLFSVSDFQNFIIQRNRMEEEKKQLDDLMRNVMSRYIEMLRKFVPCKPGSGEFLEQNLITNFAIAFVTKFPNANVYTEVPFISSSKLSEEDDAMSKPEKWNCRADLYIENGDCGYIIEAKGSQKGEALFELIEKDIERLKSIGLKKSFIDIAKGRENLPKNIYGIIIADYWGVKKEKSAQAENKFIQKWNKNEFDDKHAHIEGLIKLPAYEVDASDDYPYWFLVGLTKLEWE